MDVAFCYENVNPARGGCETYISDLARRLAKDGHTIHLYACRWEAKSLPPGLIYHAVPSPGGIRFLRPWRFAKAVADQLAKHQHDVSVGFDKTWGQDILYPQGGLHVASASANKRKFPGKFSRAIATLGKWLDPAAWSFARLERRQYLCTPRPRILVNSRMVQQHFRTFYDLGEPDIHVLPSAIDPTRFTAADREERRRAERRRWQVGEQDACALFVAMNYRLKGLDPLLRALPLVPRDRPFQLIVVGHPKFQRYQRLAQRLGVGDRVRFLGFRADPKDAYFAADFLVHPTFYDPCSLVVLEALACGLPIVTTIYNGASELLNPPHDGLVIDDPHDRRELADALTTFIDPEIRRIAAAVAKRTAQQWTFENHYQQFLEHCRAVMALKVAR